MSNAPVADRPQTQAPTPTGKRLAAFPRRGPEGQEQELRIVLDDYQGHAFVAARLWQRDHDGCWWPLKGKGCSIRLSEARGVAEALGLALAMTADHEPDTVPMGRRTPGRRPPARRGDQRARLPLAVDPSLPPVATAAAEGFDEF